MVVTVTASLVPKVEDEKRVPNIGCMGGHILLEFLCQKKTGQTVNSMAGNGLACAKYTTQYTRIKNIKTVTGCRDSRSAQSIETR